MLGLHYHAAVRDLVSIRVRSLCFPSEYSIQFGREVGDSLAVYLLIGSHLLKSL